MSSYFSELRLRMLNNQPNIVYANDNYGTNTLTHSTKPTFENPSSGSIHFQNAESGQNSSALSTSGGVINEAFLPDNYLQLAQNETLDSTQNPNPEGYSPLSSNMPAIGPELIKIHTRTNGAIPKKRPSQHKPELPPRDHPQPKKYNSNSSLDSGNLTPNGYPKMGTGPTVATNLSPRGQLSNNVSPRGSDISSSNGQSQGQPRIGINLPNGVTSSPLGFSPQEYALQDKSSSPLTPNFTPPTQSPIRTPNFTPPKLSPVSMETFAPSVHSDQRRTRAFSSNSSPVSPEKISQV